MKSKKLSEVIIRTFKNNGFVLSEPDVLLDSDYIIERSGEKFKSSMLTFDSEDGKELWSYKLPFIGSSPPVTYLIDGEQYVLINATGSFSLKKGYPNLVKFGNSIMVFKLKK